MSEQTLFFFDLDGTLFDPDFRAFYAVFYNRRTFALIRRKKGKVILITGRAKWDFWTKFQAYFVGVSKPDVVVVAAGSEIRHRNNNGVYEQDMEWEKNMRNTGWDKHALQQKLASFLHSHNHHTFPFPNTNAILVPVYSVAIPKVRKLRDSIQSFLGSQVKTLLTEQLLLPNNDEVFSGYIMILPATSGKENAALYLKSKFEHARALLLFGDASIDIEMLTMKYGSANIGRFAVSPTPHARIMLKDKKEVVILEGSVPRSINRIIRDFFRVKSSTRNSPFRLLLKPFEFVIDRLFYPNLTADEISLKGLSLVQTGLVKLNSKNNILTKVHGYYLVLFGYSLDLLDGIRARQKPHLKSKDGQLIDVYADRKKEMLQLFDRHKPATALSCLLPSIARAKAESEGIAVPEYDPYSGSMLSRTRKLFTALLYESFGFIPKVEQLDDDILRTNLATYQHRVEMLENAKGNISVKKNPESKRRWEFLVGLLQISVQGKKISNPHILEIVNKYSEISISSSIQKLIKELEEKT